MKAAFIKALIWTFLLISFVYIVSEWGVDDTRPIADDTRPIADDIRPINLRRIEYSKMPGIHMPSNFTYQGSIQLGPCNLGIFDEVMTIFLIKPGFL
jgi:hypothetical protein